MSFWRKILVLAEDSYAKTLSEISKLSFCRPMKFWFLSSLSQTLSLCKLSLKTLGQNLPFSTKFFLLNLSAIKLPLLSYWRYVRSLMVFFVCFEAVVVYSLGQPLVIQDVLVDPPKKMEVRIQILYTSICHTDLGAWLGTVWDKPSYNDNFASLNWFTDRFVIA